MRCVWPLEGEVCVWAIMLVSTAILCLCLQVFLSVCEGVVEALVEECVTQLTKGVVNECIDDLLRRYVRGAVSLDCSSN